MFIKRGGSDGKIVDILDEEHLTEEQKKSVKKVIKQSDSRADISLEKKSEN